MKKLTTILLVFALALAACGAFAAETTAFSLDGTYHWGMSEDEIRATLDGYMIEKEMEMHLDYLDPDEHKYTFEGLSGEIGFGLDGDKLVLIELDFDDMVSSTSVNEALTALYGTGKEVADLTEVPGLDGLIEPDDLYRDYDYDYDDDYDDYDDDYDDDDDDDDHDDYDDDDDYDDYDDDDGYYDYDHDLKSYVLWSLDDDTSVLMITDADDDDVKVLFYHN